MERVLGKISNITLGNGGYDGAMFGVSVTLSLANGCGVQDFKGGWQTYPKQAKYSENEWDKSHIDTYFWLRDLMKDAKVSEFNKLKGMPIEAQVESGVLKSWRILTEVL